ncbi:hypothetical protein GA0061070_105728 [Kosakonia oryziphila]|uniref:Uncharacterized protein n=1 Tax=Kosakonia oryziphila TaxID=1005667 RepID=A0A1C4GA54_9ENTR|nr:hypothetical protein GA0061070_105728 [Kosakonia oryziphila]
MKKRTYKNKHTASSGSAGQPDISDALKSDPALSAFTFDGPYSVTDGYDLLDSMCCVDNGRYYETPIDWKGLTRAFAQSPLHQSALYFKRNVRGNVTLTTGFLCVCAGLVCLRKCLP